MTCYYYPPGPLNYHPFNSSYQGAYPYQNSWWPSPFINIPQGSCGNNQLWIPPFGSRYFNMYIGPHHFKHLQQPVHFNNQCIPPRRPRCCNMNLTSQPQARQGFRPPHAFRDIRLGDVSLSGLFPSLNYLKNAAKRIIPRNNSTSGAPPTRATTTPTPSTPPTPAPKKKKKDTHKRVMPQVHPPLAIGAQDAQVSDPNMLQRFVYSIDDGKTLQYVDPEDALVLDLAALCKIAFENARRSPPSYECPCCVGSGLRDVDHRIVTTCEINGERRQKIVCPIILDFFKKHRASTGGNE